MREKTNKRNRNKGFSLVELIVVIAIMAVLVGVLAPQFIGYVAKSRQATDVQNAQTLAMEIAVKIADAEAEGTALNYATTWAPVDTTVVSKVPAVRNGKVNQGKFYYMVDTENTVHIAVAEGTNKPTDPVSGGAVVSGSAVGPKGQLYPEFGVNTVGGNNWYDKIKN